VLAPGEDSPFNPHRVKPSFYRPKEGLNDMAQRAQVKCINKRDRQDAHERIHSIGGSNGTPWKLPEDDAIGRIKRGEWEFYVIVNGKEVKVVVATHAGREYLKTEADGYAPNNLLNLPECP